MKIQTKNRAFPTLLQRNVQVRNLIRKKFLLEKHTFIWTFWRRCLESSKSRRTNLKMLATSKWKTLSVLTNGKHSVWKTLKTKWLLYMHPRILSKMCSSVRPSVCPFVNAWMGMDGYFQIERKQNAFLRARSICCPANASKSECKHHKTSMVAAATVNMVQWL